MARRERNVRAITVGAQIRSPQPPTPAEVNLFPIPHRPTKLLIEPAACKSLKILEVASRALASLLITERGICRNRAGKRAAHDATLATSLRFSLGEQTKKIPTDKSWDFEYWWRRRESNPRPQVLHSQDYMLSLVIWVSPRARQPAGWRSASRFDGSARLSDQTVQSS